VSVPVIAIDGPSASGKGAVASRVAQTLGFHYLESGALYRVLALIALRTGEAGEARPGPAATTMPLRFQDGKILLSEQDISEEIRSEACANKASEVARIPGVRQALMDAPKGVPAGAGLVADGRDMGTVVFPDAGLKIFLTASPEVRAERRYKQLIDKESLLIFAPFPGSGRTGRARQKRSVAPLVPAPDSQSAGFVGAFDRPSGRASARLVAGKEFGQARLMQRLVSQLTRERKLRLHRFFLTWLVFPPSSRPNPPANPSPRCSKRASPARKCASAKSSPPRW